MDFKTRVPGALGLAGVSADALMVLLVGEAVPAALDKSLAAALSAAVKDGDFAFKAGQLLYAHRVTGVKAPRVIFVYAGDGSAKAFRKAVASGIGAIKGGGTQELAVALVGAELGDAHGEALVAAATAATYVYRATKPSAAAPGALRSVVQLCS